jgi:hypothetical protein
MAFFGKHEEKIPEDTYVMMQKQMMTMPREQVKMKVGELMKMYLPPESYLQRVFQECDGRVILLYRTQFPLYHREQGLYLSRMPGRKAYGTEAPVVLSHRNGKSPEI